MRVAPGGGFDRSRNSGFLLPFSQGTSLLFSIEILAMRLYRKYILPKAVHFICSAGLILKQREKIAPLAAGRVLEIGIGSGLNLPLYDPAKVKHVWGLDPSLELWAMAAKTAARAEFSVEFIKAGAEAIPLDDSCADTVVVTYTLCTLSSLALALGEMRRVLKPDGRLIFCEHGAAPDEAVRRWQDWLNPIWKRIAGGCNLNLPIPSLLQQAGFKIWSMNAMYLPGWKPVTFNYWGTAASAK
jgi:ubiquinone/menaquinone biosynthesis C-methylase UbiE